MPFDIAAICNNSSLMPILRHVDSQSPDAVLEQNVPAPDKKHKARCDSCVHVSRIITPINLYKLVKRLGYLGDTLRLRQLR